MVTKKKRILNSKEREIIRIIHRTGGSMSANEIAEKTGLSYVTVRKYLKIAQNMARQENLSPYLIQRLDMIEKEIDSVFKNDKVEQKSLFEFM